MLKFNLTDGGRTVLNNHSVIDPLILDAVALKNGDTQIKTLTDFSGSVYNDSSGIGEYVKIVLEDSSDTSYTATSIILKSSNTDIAISSQNFSIVKSANKGIKIELSCQFEMASRCGFSTYTVSLPTATKFREGVVRLAGIDGSNPEPNKACTVYSAEDVDAKIDSISIDLSGHFVPWKVVNESPVKGTAPVDCLEVVDDIDNPTKVVSITITNDRKLSIDTTLTGNVVSSTPTITGVAGSRIITGSDKVVNESYVSSLYADAISSGNSEKLVTSYAVSTFVSGEISTAVNALQEQIDAINAGQNLADIVDQIVDLKSHDVTNLQAKGKEGVTIGDKIQVLHDKTDSTGTVIPSSSGVATVYELIYGTIDKVTYPKDQESTTAGYYWHYIGEYGSDCYTKAESDSRFLIKENLDRSVTDQSTDNNAPTSLAVYTFVNNAIASASSSYAKLNSNNVFTGTTNTFNTISATSYTGDGVYSTYDSSTWNTSTYDSTIPTVESVKNAIEDSKVGVLNTLHTTNEVGSIGLFIYSISTSGYEVEKPYGSDVNGVNLKPVAMSLSMSGQISYKSVNSSPSMSGTWRLLSAAMRVTATEPCLVLAQKISDTYNP